LGVAVGPPALRPVDDLHPPHLLTSFWTPEGDHHWSEHRRLRGAEQHAAHRTLIPLGSAQAEAFIEVEQEFSAGDSVEFTRNNYRAERHNGDTAEVVAIAPQGASMILQREDGRRDMLDIRHLADRHFRPGWGRTIHLSQGTTCDWVMTHLESFRANTVDATSVYVAISRAQTGAAVYTDSHASLTEALGLRHGAQVGAIDKAVICQMMEEFSMDPGS
jgi:hypothetical protein